MIRAIRLKIRDFLNRSFNTLGTLGEELLSSIQTTQINPEKSNSIRKHRVGF